MASRLGWFVLGGVVALSIAAAYSFLNLGGVPMAATSKPLPFEAAIAHMALHANVAPAAKLSDRCNSMTPT